MSFDKAGKPAAPQVGFIESVDAEDDRLCCVACTSRFQPDEMATLRCADAYCAECLTSIFRAAMTHETMYPPSCCGLRISLKAAQSVISGELLKLYRAKGLELATKNKTYCWKPSCSTFIAPHSTHNNMAYCQTCRAVTCTLCKGEDHFGKCTDGTEKSFLEFISKTKFKPCPGCKRIIEKNGGCSHIVSASNLPLIPSVRLLTDHRCRCGTEMCYGCGEESQECVCSGDEEDYDEEEDIGIGGFD